MTDEVADRDGPLQAKPFVREALNAKSLHFSLDEVQSRMQLRHPDVLDLIYTRTMMGFLLFAPAPADILMVGLGGGSLAKFCGRHLPRTRIEVIEINPHVIALRDEFKVPADSERFHVVHADAAVFMAETSSRHDVVLLDGFGPQGLPPQLGTPRFYDDCADALHPGGVLVANFHTAARDFGACVGRIERSFGSRALVVGDREAVNSIVFARKGGALSLPAGGLEARRQQVDRAVWTQLSGAFERVATAVAKQAKGAGIDGSR